MLSADLVGSNLRIEGTDANDVIVIEAGEGDGQVVLSGVDGVEDGTVFSGVDRIGVKLGDGDDIATILGAMRTTDGDIMAIRIAGNFGDDQLFGGDSLDTFLGGPGDDVLEGGSHGDFLYGGAGFDDLFGGDGDDFIQGGRHGDVVRGHDGVDQLLGGRGFDTVVGGGGSDVIFGGWGADTVVGGAGNDAIHGDRGNDVIRGGSGADEIHGDGGADEVFGGIGQDWLFGGEGDDTITGGDGSDTILAPPSEVQDASDEDAKWVDSAGNELDFSAFTDDFWTALGTVSDALRSGNVDRIDSTLDELAGALEEQAEAFFDLLGEIVDDAPVEQDTFTEFQETVSQVADGVEEFFEELADEVVDDSSDSDDDGNAGEGGDNSGSGSTFDLSFLEGENVPPSFLEAIDILKGVVGGELPDEFWESARRLLDNQDRFIDRIETLTSMLSPELLDGLKDRVDVLMEAIFADGFDPRVDPEGFAAEVEVRIADAFGEFTGEQRDAVLNTILAGARRDSAAEHLVEIALELGGGVLPTEFWEAWERAGDEANGTVDGEFPDEYQRAIEILTALLGGEVPGTFWDRFDAFRIAIDNTNEAFNMVLESMDDAQRLELAPWLWDFADELIDAGYEPGGDIAALIATIDPEVAARFDGATDATMAAVGVLLDADFREHQLEEAVFEVVLDLLGGVLPVEFVDAWEDAGDDFSNEFDFLYQPGVPPSFIEAVEILRAEVGGELPEDFWNLASRLLDNQGRFMDRLSEFTSLLDPDQLVGMKDRVDLFMESLFNDGFDPRVDLEAFEAELEIRLADVFADMTREQRDALEGVIRAGIRRDSAVAELEALALQLGGGELPPEFWDAWQRAGDEANGLVHGVFPPQFDEVIGLISDVLGVELPGEFWDRFDAFLFSMGDLGFAFDQVLSSMTDDEQFELLPFVFDLVDAMLAAGYTPGADFASFMAQIDQTLASRFESASEETFGALGELVEVQFRADEFEDGVLGLLGELFGGQVPQEVLDAWEAALDFTDGDHGGDHGGGVDELVGLDGVMPQEFFDAIDVVQAVLTSELPPDFWVDVELLVQSVGTFAGNFGAVMATLDQAQQEQLAFPILDINNFLYDLGYRADNDSVVETFIAQLDPEFIAMIDSVSAETRDAMFVLFAEGARRADLADIVEQKLFDNVDAIGVAMPDEFFILWDLAGDLVLGT